MIEDLLDGDEPDPRTRLRPETRAFETPTEDAAEQLAPLVPGTPGEAATGSPAPFEANEYDALEQSRVVEFDDDY